MSHRGAASVRVGVAGRLTARHRQVMRLVVRPSVIKPAKPSPRMRATTAAASGFLATTVRRTPPGMVSVRADQSGMPSSSAACGTTIAPMACSVRPAPVISMARPPGTGAGLTAARSTTSFMSMRCWRNRSMSTLVQSVAGSASRILTTSAMAPKASCPGIVGPPPAILRIISMCWRMCSACLSGPGAAGESC